MLQESRALWTNPVWNSCFTELIPDASLNSFRSSLVWLVEICIREIRKWLHTPFSIAPVGSLLYFWLGGRVQSWFKFLKAGTAFPWSSVQVQLSATTQKCPCCLRDLFWTLYKFSVFSWSYLFMKYFLTPCYNSSIPQLQLESQEKVWSIWPVLPGTYSALSFEKKAPCLEAQGCQTLKQKLPIKANHRLEKDCVGKRNSGP